MDETKGVSRMKKEEIEVIEHATKGLQSHCWWDCDGCPYEKKCNEECEKHGYEPPCETLLFKAIEIVKGLSE